MYTHKRRGSIYMTTGKRRVKSHKDVEAYLVALKDGKSTRPKYSSREWRICR